MKKRMTICLLILGTLLPSINVKANDNFNHNAGFQKFISEIDIDISIDKEYYTIKNHNGFKSYMSYKKITDESSNQYKLQQLVRLLTQILDKCLMLSLKMVQ